MGARDATVVVKDVQRHPAEAAASCISTFQRVVEDEEITLHVPIHFIGEAAAKGVKEQGGVIEHMLTDVEVICLPRHLPEYLELDVSNLELNDIYHLSDIQLPEGVSLVALAHGQDHAVVAINPPRREEEEQLRRKPRQLPARSLPPAQAEPTEDSSARLQPFRGRSRAA